MSILKRGLDSCRCFSRNRSLTQRNRAFSLCLRHEDALLRFSNSSYAFPPSPPSHIQVEQTGSVRPAFLEEPTGEYDPLNDIESHGDIAVRSPEAQAAEVILRLIAKGDFDEALAARNEFVKLGVEIARDRAFAAAAIAELSVIDPEVRSRRFIAWWSLTPLSDCPDKVALACAKLMDHPFDLPLLMDFCVLCAKMGFASVVEKSKLFPHIFRHGNSNATTAFLLKLEYEAEKCRKEGSPKAWMSMRNLAIRMHLLAGRKQVATEMYEEAVAKGFIVEPQTSELVAENRSAEARPVEVISTKSLLSPVPKDNRRSISELAHELRILRRIVMSREQPPHFEVFLAEFIDAYELLGRRSYAIRMLREKVFKDGSLAVRARWVAGEQLAFSMRKRPIAILRTYMNYCLSDNILATEARPILAYWRQQNGTVRKKLDWKLSQKPVKTDWKIWPTYFSMSLTWKALLQLSKKRDIDRLYALLLKHVGIAQNAPKRLADRLRTTSDLKVANEHYYDSTSHIVSVPPAVFPNASYFHHFVVAYATRDAPRRGAQVLADMQRVGIPPSKESWGAVAGAYARSGDLKRVLRILDHLDGVVNEPGAQGECAEPNTNETGKRPSQTSLVTYNSVLRGFTEAAMYPEARTIQYRMQQRGFFRTGVDKRTHAILRRLSAYERGKYDGVLYRRNRNTIVVDGRRIVVDKKRAEWLTEDKKI